MRSSSSARAASAASTAAYFGPDVNRNAMQPSAAPRLARCAATLPPPGVGVFSDSRRANSVRLRSRRFEAVMLGRGGGFYGPQGPVGSRFSALRPAPAGGEWHRPNLLQINILRVSPHFGSEPSARSFLAWDPPRLPRSRNPCPRARERSPSGASQGTPPVLSTALRAPGR